MEYGEIKKKIREAESCSHDKTILCRRKARNGTFQVMHQCERCGERVGNFLSHSQLQGKRMDDLPDWNEELTKNSRDFLLGLTAEAWRVEKLKEIEAKLKEYYQYLKSPEWRQKTALVLKRDNNLCQSCLIQRASQVHHLTYQRIYEEPLFDLIALCKECHERLHPENEKSLRRIYDLMMSAADPKYS